MDKGLAVIVCVHPYIWGKGSHLTMGTLEVQRAITMATLVRNQFTGVVQGHDHSI